MPREHEFDQDDVFGVCKNCGKYVEQLIDERYCTVTAQPQTKYPGADTSKERLASVDWHFLRKYKDGTAKPKMTIAEWLEKMRKTMPNHPALGMYDLLAMIEERNAKLAEIFEWYDRDGSVGAASELFERLRK